MTTGGSGGGLINGLTRRRLLQTAGATAATYPLAKLLLADTARATAGAGANWRGVSGDCLALARNPQAARTAFAAMSLGNVTTVRFPVRWDLIQLEEHSYDWSALDQLHRELLWYGANAVPVVVGCPNAWLPRSSTGGSSTPHPSGMKALTAMGKFVVQLRDYFSRFGGRVAGIEVWSEPSGPGDRYAASPTAFARMVEAVTNEFAIADASSMSTKTPIIAGGLTVDPAGKWRRYVDTLDAALPAVDLGLHFPTPGKAERSDLMRYYLAPLDECARTPDRRVWVTVGAPHDLGFSANSDLADAWKSVASHPSCSGFFASPLTQDPLAQVSSERGVDGAPLLDESGHPTAAFSLASSALGTAS